MRLGKFFAALAVALPGALVGALVPGGSAAAAVTPAAAVQLKIAHSNKCLNVQGNSMENSAAIIQFTCGDSYVNDKFRVEPVGTTGTYQIIANSSNKCLNVQGGLTETSTPVIQFTCVETAPNNLWTFVPVVGKPTFRIVSVQSNKCLNVRGGLQTNSDPLIIFPCTTSTAPTNDQFYFPPATSPAPQPAAVTATAPIAAVQGKPSSAAVGPIVYTYFDNSGRMRRAYQPDPSSFGNIVYTSPAGLEQFAGRPQAAVQADGRVRIAARNAEDGDLQLITQTQNDLDSFTGPQDVGGAGAGQPAIGKLPDGNLVTFAIVNGSMWHLPQEGTNLPYAAWRQIGGSDLAGEPTVVTIRDGLRLFALTTTGTAVTAAYRNGLLSDWVSLGTETFTGSVAAAVFPGYRTRIVVRDAAGLVFTKVETATDVFEPTWSQVGTFAAAGSPATVMDDQTGVAAIVARGADGLIYITYETAQASKTFVDWRAPIDRVVATDPSILTFNEPSSGGGAARPVWGWVVRAANDQPYFVSANLSGALAKQAARSATSGSAKAPAPKAAFKGLRRPCSRAIGQSPSSASWTRMARRRPSGGRTSRGSRCRTRRTPRGWSAPCVRPLTVNLSAPR